MSRLSKRATVRWGFAYLAAAWVIIEVTSLLADQFGLPGWFDRSVTIAAVFGFLGTEVVAWHRERRRPLALSGAAVLVGLTLVGVATVWLQVHSDRTRQTLQGAELRVLRTTPPEGEPLSASDLEAGVPLRITVEHSVAARVQENLALWLLVKIRGEDPSDEEETWRLSARQAAGPDRTRVSIATILTPRDVISVANPGQHESEVVVRIALAVEGEDESAEVGRDASVIIRFPVID